MRDGFLPSLKECRPHTAHVTRLILVGFLRERKPKSGNEVARRAPGFVEVEGAKILGALVVPHTNE